MQHSMDFGPSPKELSSSQFKERWNLFVLRPNHTLGLQYSTTWAGLTVLPPGKYEARVVYKGAATLPIVLDRPLLQGPIVSNVVKIEVLP
jgi:hypothetical protein